MPSCFSLGLQVIFKVLCLDSFTGSQTFVIHVKGHLLCSEGNYCVNLHQNNGALGFPKCLSWCIVSCTYVWSFVKRKIWKYSINVNTHWIWSFTVQIYHSWYWCNLWIQWNIGLYDVVVSYVNSTLRRRCIYCLPVICSIQKYSEVACTCLLSRLLFVSQKMKYVLHLLTSFNVWTHMPIIEKRYSIKLCWNFEIFES